MRKVSRLFLLFLLSASAGAQNFKTVEVYTVLDAGNDNSGSITRNNATTGNLGATTGQERGIAVRPGQPPIVYIARGATSTGDGRTGGAIGLAAIKLQAKSDGDFNPRTTPDLPLNYLDTGLIVSGGSPANFTFIQGIFYESVLDKVWLLDGATTNPRPRVWYFDGGSTGGAEHGGDVARTAAGRNIRSPFQADNGSGLGGRGQSLAVRVDPQNKNEITVAVAMGNHVEVWQSAMGLAGPWSLKFESSDDPDGSGPIPAFDSSSVRDVAFDEQGDVWITNQQSSSNNFLHRYDSQRTGRGILASESFNLPAPPFVLQPAAFAQGFNAIKFYRQGDAISLIAVNRSNDDSRITVVRYRRNGRPGAYSFTAVDGFGSNVGMGMSQDMTLSTLRLKGSSSQTQPGEPSPEGLMYLSLPSSSAGDLTLSEPALYLNGFVIDDGKNQTRPTSGIIRVSFTP